MDDDWDIEDAHVVCRQLGYPGAAEAPCCGHFGQGSGAIWMDNVACTGDEGRLADCPFSGWGVAPSDSHAEDAGVVCAGGRVDAGVVCAAGLTNRIFRGSRHGWRVKHGICGTCA